MGGGGGDEVRVWGKEARRRVCVGVLLPDDFGKACDPCQQRNDKGSSFTAAWEEGGGGVRG